MKKKRLFLGLILSMCFSVGVSAQDATQEADKTNTEKVEKKKKGADKKAERRKKKMVANFAKNYSAIELTEEQTATIDELLAEHYEGLTGVQTELDAVIDAETRKTRAKAMKAARADGKPWPEANKIANEEAGVSEEDAEKLAELNKKRNEMMASIKEAFAESLTDEQKEALAAAKPKKGKGKGKAKGKGKGKGKKKMKDGDDAEGGLVSVSIKLPGMT